MTYAEFAAYAGVLDAQLSDLGHELQQLIDQANGHELSEAILQDLANSATTFRNLCRTARDNFVAASILLTT